MSTYNATTTTEKLRLLLALIVLLAICVATPAQSATGEGRSSVSNHLAGAAAATVLTEHDSIDQYGPLEISGGRNRTTQTTSEQKPAAAALAQQLLLSEFWIYEADVVLFADDDADGHFYGVDLLLDADTVYGSADVYAAVYLSLEGGPWNEYAVTEDFTIFGESGSDEYSLVTELMSGYPTGSYDLLIELFDAFDGSFLASFGPEDTSALGYLPLEDFNRDAPGFDSTVIVTVSESGGGGATSLMTLLLLLLLVLLLMRQGSRNTRQADFQTSIRL
jgi:hypothetical protein